MGPSGCPAFTTVQRLVGAAIAAVLDSAYAIGADFVDPSQLSAHEPGRGESQRARATPRDTSSLMPDSHPP